MRQPHMEQLNRHFRAERNNLRERNNLLHMPQPLFLHPPKRACLFRVGLRRMMYPRELELHMALQRYPQAQTQTQNLLSVQTQKLFDRV